MATKKAVQKQEELGFVEKSKRFLKSVWAELKKVHWPNRQQILAYTGVVLFAVAFVAALLWIMDTGLGLLMRLIY